MKRFELSNRLDIALYKNVPFLNVCRTAASGGTSSRLQRVNSTRGTRSQLTLSHRHSLKPW